MAQLWVIDLENSLWSTTNLYLMEYQVELDSDIALNQNICLPRCMTAISNSASIQKNTHDNYSINNDFKHYYQPRHRRASLLCDEYRLI
jgi:hypothetical protein